jgi:hypothetical protein
MEKIFDIQSFIWWESDSFYKWPAFSFYSWENINIRKNLEWITLSSMLEDTGWSIDWNVTCMVNLETLWVRNWWIVVCTDTGKIYLDWESKYTLTNFIRVIWIWVMYTWWVQYVYYVSQTSSWSGKIHRSTTDLAPATFIESHRSYTTSVWIVQKAIIINAWWWLYIATKNKVIELDYLEVVRDLLVLTENEKIVWFTSFQNTYRIYSNLENSWIQYIWDWASMFADYKQIWENQSILWIQNDWPYDYAILWFNQSYSDLYLISWTQKQELRVNLENSLKSRKLDWYLSIREWILYISWWQSWESNNYWIYTYWNYYPWTPKSLVQEYSKSISYFTFHSHSVANSYFVCNDWKIYKTLHNNPPDTYASSWEVVSQVFQWNVWDEMTYKLWKISFKLNTWEIKIYVRTDIEHSWTLFKTISNANYNTVKRLRLDVNEFKALWLWNFTEIQFKFVLTKWSTWTPLLKRATFWFDTLEK